MSVSASFAALLLGGSAIAAALGFAGQPRKPNLEVVTAPKEKE